MDPEHKPSEPPSRRRRRHAHDEPDGRFRAAADHAPVLIFTTGVTGLVDYVNGRSLEFTGLTPEELAGHGWVQAVHPADRAGALESLRAGVSARRPYEQEVRLRRRDGEYRWMLHSGAPRYLPGGEFAGLVCSSLDITERKSAEEDRVRLLAAAEQARAQAEAANRTKDEFLATLSHELRTPLNAIVGWVHLLRGGQLDEPTTRRALETIDRNAKIQTQLIADILDVSRIVSGKLRVQMRPLELAPIVEAAVDTVRLAAEAKAIHLAVAVDPLAGPVLGDADRLQQVVWNLLSNAIKFTADAGAVQVSLRRAGAQAALRVADNGAGIAPEFLPFVFDRFRQADASSTRAQGGLGLGLAIARHLALLHGGSLSAESPGSGHGAVFTLCLPIVEAAQRPEAYAVAAAALGSPSLDGVSVLVVAFGDAAEPTLGALRDRGAEVLVAARAEEAVDLVKRLRPDVLLAWRNGGDEGHGLIRAVRDIPPERGGLIPAALLGGGATAEERLGALLAGYQAQMPGSVAPPELVTVVASLAGRTRELLG